jgi:HK97 gp10 family phage protein
MGELLMAGNRITVKVTRKEVMPGGIKGLGPKIRAGAIDGLNAIGLGMLSTAKQKIQRGSKSGTTYQKYGPRRTHRSSAPGEAPATDTGGLVNSGFQEMDEGALEVQIGFAKFYAAFLEYGTRIMAKRPFLLPTVEEWKKKIVQIMKAAIQARLK